MRRAITPQESSVVDCSKLALQDQCVLQATETQEIKNYKSPRAVLLRLYH